MRVVIVRAGLMALAPLSAALAQGYLVQTPNGGAPTFVTVQPDGSQVVQPPDGAAPTLVMPSSEGSEIIQPPNGGAPTLVTPR